MMKHAKTVKTLAQKCTALLCCSSLFLMGVPAAAFAAEGSAQGTLDCGNGWILNCSTESGQVTVTGVATAGSGLLTVPASMNGAPVTTIGERAFYQVSALSSISLPQTVTSLEAGAFFGSGLTSFAVPDGVNSFSENCFRECKQLTSVTFSEGRTFGFIDQRAFSDCTSLKEFVFPPLTGTVETDPFNVSIGVRAFSGCSSLEKFTFLPGGKNTAEAYFADSTCFENCDKLESWVWYCKKQTIGILINQTYESAADKTYYAVNFYNSAEDAAAGTGRIAQVLMPATTTFQSIVDGTADSSKAYPGSDAIPAAPAGKVWGFSDDAIEEGDETLYDSFNAIAVEPTDIHYGWLISPEMKAFGTGVSLQGVILSEPARAARYFLEEDGSLDLSDVHVYGPNFEPVSESLYTVSWEKLNYVPNTHAYSYYYAVDGIDGAGIYKMIITGLGEYSDVTMYRGIYVDDHYYPEDAAYNSVKRTTNVGKLMDTAALAFDQTPAFAVVAPASDWRFCLVGAGLSGVGGGFTVYADGDDTGDAAFRAISDSGVDSVSILGSEKMVSASVEDRIHYLSNMGSGSSIDRFDCDTPQSLALDVYNTIAEFGDMYGYAWGSTAILCSPVNDANAGLAAQVARSQAAPVFFTEDDGTVSAKTLAALKDGSFSKVLLVGGTAKVSAAVEKSVAAKCPLATVERILTENNLLSASVSLRSYSGNDASPLVVASASDPANVVAAAEYAGTTGGSVIACACENDVAKMFETVVGWGKRSVDKMYLLGDFSGFDSDFATQYQAFWESGAIPSPEVSSKGIVVEADSLLYSTTGSKATLVGVLNPQTTTVLSVNTAELSGTLCKVTAVSGLSLKETAVKTVVLGSNVTAFNAGLFAGSSVTKVELQGAVSKIPAKAFMGCKKLKTLIVKSTKLTKSKVGANAFKNVSASVTVKVPKAKLKTYKTVFVAKGLSAKAKFVAL